MRVPILLLALVCIPLAACKKPAPPPDDQQPAPRVQKPVPVAGTGALADPGEPSEALMKRTYFLLPEGDRLWAGTTAGIVTWDLTDPAKAERSPGALLPGSVAGLSLLEGEKPILAACTGPTGVSLLDASADLAVLSDGTWASAGGCHAAWRTHEAGEGAMLVACATSGVAEADVSDPASPRVTRILSIGGYVRDLDLLDGPGLRAAVAAGPAGLVLVEFPPSGQPRILSTLATGDDARALLVDGSLAYVANGASGLLVADLSDPANPGVEARFDPEASDMARGLTLSGTTLYLCMGEAGLLILDVSNPASPEEIGSHDPGRALNRVAVQGTHLYAANDDAGLLILDVEDPSKPTQIFPVPED
jgi:hypothetical protein